MTTNSYSLPHPVSRELSAIRTGFRFLTALAPELAGKVAFNLFLTPRRRAVSKKSRPIFNEAKHVTIPHGSRQLAAYVWGNEGPTILLVHGWESDASRMRGFIRPLRQQGFRVIAFDAPAHGNSTGKQTNLVDYSGSIHSVVQKLGPVDGIVAHSFGAATTMLMLSRSPNIGVKCVVTIGSPSNPSKMVQIWTSALALKRPIVDRMMQRIVDRVGVPFESLVVETAVSHLTIPGLIFHDKNDSIVPYTEGVAIARSWQSAELVATEGLDHRGALYNSKIINQITLFLADQIELV
ncbi:MAG: alpha/beta fold hydrolase [Chloroflexi bacterium]|nr:MAG: alpha/beta fold hydrolase [Chloroflexota bacterium]